MLKILNKYIEEGLVYSQRHPELPLTIFNYTDACVYAGNKWNEITLQCRGLVVDDNGVVVARPFKKFFNLSEGRTNVTNNYVIYEKLDGSFIQCFWYSDQWVISSRGSFTSDQAIQAQKFLDTRFLDKANTYCYELIADWNRIVVKYDYEALVLTGVFNTETGEELPLGGWGVEFARVMNFKTSLKDLHTTIKDNEEGYVIRFDNGERCKIKGAEYLRLHKAMSEMSTTAIWECLSNGGSVTDVLDSFPDEWFSLVREYEESLKFEFRELKRNIELEYLKTNVKLSDKEYALSIKSHIFAHYFFSLRKGRDITERVWKDVKPSFRKI